MVELSQMRQCQLLQLNILLLVNNKRLEVFLQFVDLTHEPLVRIMPVIEQPVHRQSLNPLMD